jgi:tRNA(adenine34) deaminase
MQPANRYNRFTVRQSVVTADCIDVLSPDKIVCIHQGVLTKVAQQQLFDNGFRYLICLDSASPSFTLRSRSKALACSLETLRLGSTDIELFLSALDAAPDFREASLLQSFQILLKAAAARAVFAIAESEVLSQAELAWWQPLDSSSMQMHIDLMQTALDLLRDQPKSEVPVAAVVVNDGEIIGQGVNAVETNGIVTAHAELIAIAEASAHVGGWRLFDCDIYSTLEPCPMCLGAISHAGFRHVYFGAEQTRGKVHILKRMQQGDTLWSAGVCAAECKNVLDAAFKKIRL